MGLPLQVNTTVCGDTAPYLEEMAAFVQKLGIVFWEVFFLVPMGRGSLLRGLDAAECERLFELLYRVQRIDLKDDIDCDPMEWSVLEDPRNYDTINEIRPPCYTNASGDFLLLDRDSYQRLRGFNEVYRVAKVHMDSNFCLKAYSSGLTLVPLDAPVYHVGRGTLNSQMALYANRPADAPWGDTRWKRAVVYDNDPGWGLWNAPAQAVRDGIYYLEFTLAAVPPLVALGRVVLPASRVGRLEGLN